MWDLNTSNVTIYHEIKVGILDNTCFKENVLTFEILVGWILKLGPNFGAINVALYGWKCDPAYPSHPENFWFSALLMQIAALHLKFGGIHYVFILQAIKNKGTENVFNTIYIFLKISHTTNTGHPVFGQYILDIWQVRINRV